MLPLSTAMSDARSEDLARLQAEVDRLRASSFVTAVPVDEYEKLKAEVERLDTLCKQLMAQHSDISCENIMLREAGDDLWYCIRHRDFDPDAISTWQEVRGGVPKGGHFPDA